MNATPNRSRKSPLPDLTNADNINLMELEKALIQNVHRGYEKVIVEKEFKGGYSGTRVFLVSPLKSDGASDARVVTKIGPKSELSDEKKKYDKFVKGALPFTATQIWGYYEQESQAALNYVFAGDGTLGQTPSLEEYYKTHSAAEVKATLDGLLGKALGPTWYGQSKPLHRLFREEYGQHLPTHEELEKVVKVIFQNMSLSPADGDRIKIPGVTELYPHPLKIYSGLLNKTLKGRLSLVHGDLHPRNVLVDESGKGWLIDFAKVTERHNLFDFIRLETYLRLMALELGAFSLNDYVQFELALNSDTLGQKATLPANPHLAKAYTVIQAIRRTARKYMGPEPDFRNEYFPALFLYCLAMLKYYPSHGAMPTQLVFITACALTVDIFEERKTMKSISNKRPNPSKKAQTPTGKAKATRPGGISIGGNATDSIIVSGNENKINRTTTRKVNTGGGAYIGGNVNVKNGDFVGRDKIDRSIKVGDINSSNGVAIGDGAQVYLTQTTGASADEIARAFAIIWEKANQERDNAKREDALQAVDKLKAEAERGEQAEESRVQRWFTFLAEASADAWDVAVATLANPGLGLGTAFRKIVQHAKEAKEKR